MLTFTIITFEVVYWARRAAAEHINTHLECLTTSWVLDQYSLSVWDLTAAFTSWLLPTKLNQTQHSESNKSVQKTKSQRGSFLSAVSHKVTVWFKSIVKINCKFFLRVCTSTRRLVFVSELSLRPAVERLPTLSCFTRCSTRENLQLCSASAQAVSVGTQGDSDHLCWQTTKTVRDDLY